jgi:hypothetical protein
MFPTVQEANAPTNVAPPLTGAPAPTPPPGPADQQAGMVGAKQDELPINQAPPTMVAATGQGEMFPSLPEANPPVAQVTPFRGDQPPPPPPGALPPGGGGGAPAATQAAVKTSQAKTPPPAGQRPSGTMKKAELNDALVGMGIDTKGMNRDDMARRFDREQARAPSTQTPPDTTVTEGPPTAPARETVPGPGAETQAAPPTQGALTPPASEGVSHTVAGYDRNPDDPLAGRIEYIKERLQDPDLTPTARKALEKRIQDLETYVENRDTFLKDADPEHAATIRRMKIDDVVTGENTEGDTVRGKINGFGDDGIGVHDADGIAHDISVKDIKTVEPAGTPTTGPKAKISTGVRPEGGAPPATDERPAGATAEVTPDVKPKEDPREKAIGHLAAAKQRVLAEAIANGQPVRRGSPAEKAINAAMEEMQRAFSDPKQDPGDVMKMLHTDARRGTPNEGETIAAYAARRALVSGMLKEITGNEKFKLPPLKLKEVADTRSEIEQVRAEEQQRGGAEATERATSSEAIPEKAAAGEATTLEPVHKGPIKTTDIVEQARNVIDRLVDPTNPLDIEGAEKEYNKTSNLGQARRKGYETLRDALRTTLENTFGPKGQARKKVLEERLAALDTKVFRTREGSAKRIAQEEKRDNDTAQLREDLKEYDTERMDAMIDALAKTTDPVKAGADARESLLNRIAEKKGEAQPLRHEVPAVTGISPRSSRLVKVATDQRMSASLIRAMRASEQHGVEFTDRDLARLVMQDPLISSEMPGLKAMAAQLFKLARDVPILTPQRAFERGLIDHGELEYSQKPGSYGSYYSEPGKEHIWVNLDQSHEHGTHVETAVHELVHSAFSHHIDYLERFDPNHRDLQALRAMREELLDHAHDAFEAGDLSKREMENLSYALSNEQEFHTMMLTNPDVQAFAASRTASDTFRSKIARLGFGLREGGRSVWSHFVDVVRKSLGFREPASASEYTLFDHFMRPVTAIAEHATRYNERYLPHDPMLRSQAEPLYWGLSQGFGDRARTAIDRIDPKGLSAKGLRAVLQSAPLDRIVERYGHLSEHIGKVRDALDKAMVAGNRFLRDYSDKAVMLSNQLRGKDDVANLMNDAGYAKAVLGSKDPEANAHLTTPEERARLAELETQFSRLPTADQELYRRVVDFGNEKYARVRAAAGNRLLNDLLPHGTDAERDVLRTAMRSRKGMDEYLRNPDNPAIDASRRVIARGIVSLHRDGFVHGDYFPMRRYGDYIVEYGGDYGTPSYGMQAFEKRSDADAFRRQALADGMDPQEVRERDSIVQNHTMRTSPVVQEMLDRINVTPELKGHADQLRDLVTRLQMQYASTGERARARRRYIAGASKDIGRALQSDTAAQGMQIGRYEHGAEIRNMMNGIKGDRDTLARNKGDAFTLDQVHHELQRQIEIGDTATWGASSSLLRKANSFGFAHSLASFSRIAVETAELHLKMASFIGARHGPITTTMEMTRALKEISPRLWTKGMTNTAKAFIGKPLSSVDYQLSEMAKQRLLEAGHNAADVNAFFKHFEDNGLFDQTRAQSLKELARSTTTGKVFDWFLEVSSAMSHASEESNRIAGTWAAFRADRSKGASTADAIKFAENVLRKAPNFAPHNKPRIATERGALKSFGAPIMQFKMYGFNEYWMLANLAKDIVSRNTDPVKRKEAIVGLTGVLMTHAMMAGVLTWYADPARYIGGAWDILTGQKPHDHSLAARKWLSDAIGPTWGEILGRGLPHAVGWDLHTRSGAENMLNVPTMNDWTPKDFALFMGQAAMGASGSDAANVISGISHMLHGEWLQGGKEMLPRLLRDPLKAYDLYDRGLVDVRGKPILARNKISGWNIASQALGFVPANVADAREGRQAIQETKAQQDTTRSKLAEQWVEADPAKRPAIWMKIQQQFNRDPANIHDRITYTQLLQLANQRRKVTAQPGAFGLQLPKNRAKELMKAGSFASNVQ